MHKLGCIRITQVAWENPCWGPRGRAGHQDILIFSRRFQGAAKFEDHGTREVEVKNTAEVRPEMDGDKECPKERRRWEGEPRETVSPFLP